MLKEMVDGKEVICSPEKEKLIRDYWALNEKYPEYSNHIAFDWTTPAFHVMEECRKHHCNLMNIACENALVDLSMQIEVATENGDSSQVNYLLAKRKSMRQNLNKDFSNCKTIEELRYSIPDEIKPYWRK
jgi:hypothetical protein